MSDQTQVVDANTASDAEVAQALGLGDVSQDDTDTSTEEQDTDQDEGQESKFEDLPKHYQDEILKLRRENAAARVKVREVRKGTQVKVSEDTVEAAREQARSEARLEYGMKLAAAEVRASLTSVIPEDRVEDVMDELNLTRYVDEEGEVDLDAVKLLKEKYQALVGQRRKPKVNTAATSSTQAKTAKQEFADLINTL